MVMLQTSLEETIATLRAELEKEREEKQDLISEKEQLSASTEQVCV